MTIKTQNRNEKYRQAARWYDRAIGGYQAGDMERARLSCLKAVSLAPRRAEFWGALGVISYELKDYGQAAKALRKAVRFDSSDHWMWNYLGNTLVELNDPRQAADAFREAVKRRPDEDVYWHNLGSACGDQGNHAEAADCFAKATALKPRKAAYWSLLGDAHLELEDYTQAAAAYRRALAIKPRDHINWYNLGVALESVDDVAGANKAYRQAAQLKPADASYQAGLGESCEALGLHGQAARAFRRATAQTLKTYRAAPAAVRTAAVKKASAQPRVFSATIDLKLTPEGRIKICEFNDLWLSGFEGFKCVTGKDLRADIVQPFYDGLLEKWRRQGLPVEKLEPRDEQQDDDVLNFFASSGKKKRSIVVANADPGFQALCIYKDYLPGVMPEALKDYVPQTQVLPLSQQAGGIAQALGADSKKLMVIKPSDSLQGNGVEVIAAGQVHERVAKIGASYRGGAADSDPYWNSNIHPNILVQECIRSAPVQAHDGLLYDGTMRVAFTAVLNPGDETPEINFHGAWWKLPAAPCSAQGGQASIVSVSPSKIKEGVEAAFEKKPFAAPVSDEHRQAAQAQLQIFLSRLLPGVAASPARFFDKVLGMMDSPQEWVRALGTRLATEHGFGNLLAKEAGTGAPAALLEKMKTNRRDHAGDGATVYLKQIFSAPRRPQTIRESHFSFDVAEYMRKGRAARELRQMALSG